LNSSCISGTKLLNFQSSFANEKTVWYDLPGFIYWKERLKEDWERIAEKNIFPCFKNHKYSTFGTGIYRNCSKKYWNDW